MTQYIKFAPIPDPTSLKKTKVVEVFSVNHGNRLGVIRWYGVWRQYAFFPDANTIWNPDCLDEINTCIRAMMYKRRIEKMKEQAK